MNPTQRVTWVALALLLAAAPAGAQVPDEFTNLKVLPKDIGSTSSWTSCAGSPGPETLNAVAEKLAQEGQAVDGAIRLTRLNLEQHPDAARAPLLLSQLLAERGDTPGATASVKRAIELEPDNR